MASNVFIEKIMSCYNNIEKTEQLIKEQYILGNFFQLLDVNSGDDKSFLVFSKRFFDPKYILPGVNQINPNDWRQRKFIHGLLLIEYILNKELEKLHEIKFIDDNAIEFDFHDNEINDALNILIKQLLDPNDESIRP